MDWLSRMESKSEPNEWSSGVWAHLVTVRRRSPLVQCITNFVSMDLVANTLLSAGASPAMVHSVAEIPDFTPHIQALCVNVGTLTPDWLPSMKAATELASQLGKPWVLDPAAVSCSGFRLKACLELIELKPTVIKGNGSEIIALSSASPSQTKVYSNFKIVLRFTMIQEFSLSEVLMTVSVVNSAIRSLFIRILRNQE